MRRLRVVNIAPEFIGMISTAGMGSIECQTGLPPGARYVYQFYDERLRCVSLVFAHESYDEVPEGQMPPLQPVQFQRRVQVSTDIGEQ